jgi:hypothetical protein
VARENVLIRVGPLLALCLVSSTAVAQGTPPGLARFEATQPQIQRAACGGRARCSVESVLAAGVDERGASLAVVRVRVGPPRCAGEAAYRDWLVALARGRVRTVRELVRGDAPCLEWQRSRWSLEDGLLVFHYSGMGAPIATPAGLDRTVRFSTAPFAIVARFAGTTRLPLTGALPASGPIFWLSMENERSLY